jgi:adenylate kinase family enzyme
MRLMVIGNSGSGKSTLSSQVGAALQCKVCDLDLIYFGEDRRPRSPLEAEAIVAAAAASSQWVIEGVWVPLLEVAARRATALLWLDLSWEACREALLRRGPHFGMDPSIPADLLAWETAHWDRLSGQAHLFDTFGGRKLRLKTAAETAAFRAGHLMTE